MTALLARVDRFVFVALPGNRLWVVRSGFAVLFGVRLAIGQHHRLGGQPPALFRPPLFWRWLDAMPSQEVIAFVQVVGVVAALLALATRRSRVPLVVAWACLVFVDGLLASRGKIMHNDLLALLAVVPVLLGPADARLRDHQPQPRWGWPVRGATVVVVIAYFCSGLAKVISSGPGWVWSDNMANVLAAAALTDRPVSHGLASFLSQHDLLARALALAALSLELGFVVVLARPRLGPWFAAGAVALHTSIWLTLGLDYWSWVVTAVLVLVDWSRLPPLNRWGPGGAPRAGPVRSAPPPGR